MLKRSLTRRSVLKTAALTPPALAAGSLPFVHGAYAAGKLSIGAWDHWVPGATQVLEKMCQEWAAKEKVELTFDAITSNGDKDLLTLMAEGQARAGHPFGLGISVCTDALNMIGAMFASYGVQLVDKDGNITVKSDKTKVALEWFQKLAKVLPGEVFAYDNASNNKALVSGQSALIFNPPSAYAVAVRDARKIAEQLWTFPSPKGLMGRYDPTNYYYWGIWNFSKNVSAAKSLLAFLSTRENQEKLVAASSGFDTPAFATFMDFKVWEEVAPPKYTVYNYPPRGDVIPSTTGWPAPLKIGTQMYAQATMTKMIAMCTQQGKSINDAIAFAENEIEGFM